MPLKQLLILPINRKGGVTGFRFIPTSDQQSGAVELEQEHAAASIATLLRCFILRFDASLVFDM